MQGGQNEGEERKKSTWLKIDQSQLPNTVQLRAAKLNGLDSLSLPGDPKVRILWQDLTSSYIFEKTVRIQNSIKMNASQIEF